MPRRFVKDAEAILAKYRQATHMLELFLRELLEALLDRTRLTEEMLQDVHRVLRGEKQIYDTPDPEDPEGKFAFVLTRKREIQIVRKALDLAAASRPRFEAMLFEMGFMYLVSLFDAFLQDLFVAAMVARPEALRSRKQITYEKVLQLGDQAAIVSYLAEREMHEVGFRSITEQFEYFEQKFGVELHKSGVSAAVLDEVYARRNLLAHNNGVVNSVYLEHAARSRVAVGVRLSVPEKYWKRTFTSFEAVAAYLATEVGRKLGREVEGLPSNS